MNGARIKRSAFENILSKAVHAHFKPEVGAKEKIAQFINIRIHSQIYGTKDEYDKIRAEQQKNKNKRKEGKGKEKRGEKEEERDGEGEEEGEGGEFVVRLQWDPGIFSSFPLCSFF